MDRKNQEMEYKVLIKQAQFLVWQNQTTNELLYTGLVGDHAMAPKTFVMNADEITMFHKDGEQYLSDLLTTLEGEFDQAYWHDPFIKCFDKDPERQAIIEARAFIPAIKSSGFWSRIFSRR